MIYDAEFLRSRHAELLAEAGRIRLAKAARKLARAGKTAH